MGNVPKVSVLFPSTLSTNVYYTNDWRVLWSGLQVVKRRRKRERERAKVKTDECT